ncbi:hypothetical protein SAMN04488511_102242 [Pedobacter suwonensis]|uniref:Uncharacterized protein n=1 Tax=Pedobacter suwonensis TaxID=332999 RepID=A0A1I0SNL3_9SPHI|nr:hypothetical protein [Pedobacter suwonensis]SFA41100.1 hypothetical protein SAMN04488511_102242 [Pedobacter suwonensis]
MKGFIMIIYLVVGCFFNSKGQQKALNIPGIHQLVSDSKAEYEKQQAARDRQRVNLINEQANRTMLARLKNSYREIQGRFNLIGTATVAMDIGLKAVPLVQGISDDQVKFYEIAKSNPALLLLVYQTEAEFLSRSKDLLSFLLGLTISIGAVNQMKVSDRKILFDFVLAELSKLRALSGGLVNIISYGNMRALFMGLNPLSDYINTDRSLIEDIIRNAKYFKK